MNSIDNLNSFFIEGRLPGLNEIIGASRRNRYGAAKQKRELTSQIAMVTRLIEIPKDARYWLFVWREPNKRRDPDNISAGTKFVFDGLQTAGVIENDGWKQVAGIIHAFAKSDTPGVEVHFFNCASDCALGWANALLRIKKGELLT